MDNSGRSSDLDSESERLLERSGEIMNGLRYTFKTHYKMAEWYEKGAKVADFFVAAGTGVLAVLLVWGDYPQEMLITIALLVAFISWSQATLKLGVKSERHFNAGDRHHRLFEEFDTFIKTTLQSDGYTTSEKRARFEELSQQRDVLNEMSPRTTNFWYNRLSEEEVRATAGNDQEEVKAIIEKGRTDSR